MSTTTKTRRLTTVLLTLFLGFAFIIPSVAFAQAELGEGAGKVAPPPEKFIYPASTQIPLPGFKYEDSVVEGNGSNGCSVGEVCVRTINYYINAMYRYSAGVAVTFAIVLIMIGGVQYMVGSAVGTIDAAKKRMWNAVIGLVLVLSTHSILTFVNPAITSFKPLGLETVPRESSFSIETRKGGEPIYLDRNDGDLRSFYDCEKDGVTEPCQFEGPDGAVPMKDVLSMNGQHAVDKSIIEDIQGVAGSMYINGANKGRKLHLKQGYRGYEIEAHRFFDNCFDGQPDCAYCDPWGAEPDISPWTKGDGGKYKLKEAYQELYDEAGGKSGGEAALKKIYLDLGPQIKNHTCPYLTGLTVDIFCAHGTGGQKGNTLRSGACHKELEEKMKAHGFCRSYYEPWHFEHSSGAITESAKACDWIPGTLVLDPDGDGFSDEDDCIMLSHEHREFITKSGQYKSGSVGCIANYGDTELPFNVDTTHYYRDESLTDIYMK